MSKAAVKQHFYNRFSHVEVSIYIKTTELYFKKEPFDFCFSLYHKFFFHNAGISQYNFEYSDLLSPVPKLTSQTLVCLVKSIRYLANVL